MSCYHIFASPAKIKTIPISLNTIQVGETVVNEVHHEKYLDFITKLPESGVLYCNITEFGGRKQSDIATQHIRRRLFCAMLFI